MLRRKACFGFLLMLWIWVWVTAKAQAESGSSLNNIKVCVSFDKSHMSFLNIGWDGSEIGVEIIYNATGRNKTSAQYTSHTRMITSLRITDGSIGNNVTVQVGPLVSNGSQHNNNFSDPITLVVNYVNDVEWTRISTSHIQFNCTLACRSAINYCSVELNGTKNSSFAINKRDFSSWAIVDFFLLDAHQAFTYAVYAEGSSNRVLGQRINGSIPPILLSTNPPNATSIMTAPDQVPGVMVITDSITLNDNNVTLTLSWDEPFNNYNPIVNYTVSCSGDVTCPPSFTTTDNTTRSYTITNLTPMTDYTFSVVATNSIGSGEAGVVNITAPSLTAVTTPIPTVTSDGGTVGTTCRIIFAALTTLITMAM